MKRLAIILAVALGTVGIANAQTLQVETGAVTYSFPATDAGDMTFGQQKTINIMGREIPLSSTTRIWVDNASVEANTVSVIYSGESAKVNIAGNIARYVDVSVTGADVSIIQNSDVSETTCGEIRYVLSGTTLAGSFYMEGGYKAGVELVGLHLTNPYGAAIDIQNGKRIAMTVKKGTVNTLTDGKDGKQKGCIVCKGHLEFKGEGTLNVRGNVSHAIYAKEYIEMKNCTINVLSAVKDGVNCNQYFLMKSGALDIKGTGDDGIQVSYKDETDREAEDTGSVTISGGTINVAVTADAAKAIKCEGDMYIKDGEITALVSGNGVWDSTKNKTKASACLGSDGDMYIENGTLNLTATGGGGKGINSDGKLTVSGGKIDIKTSGGVVVYSNGQLNNNYTGSTDRIASNLKSSAKGIKADGNVDINGGEIKVVTTGNGAEGIESKAVLTITDGTIYASATDDAINSSSHMYIKGGNITAIASGNDGLDSNGHLYIQGGYIMAFGARSPECGIDANEEEGYTVIFSGGTLLAVGGGNSLPSTSSGSTQPFVSGSGTVSANMKIELTDTTGKSLATFTVPEGYTPQSGSNPRPGGTSGSSVAITCPGLTTGSSYSLKLGSASSTVSAQLTGSNRPGRP